MFFFFLLTAIVAAAMGAAIRFDIPHGARQSWVTWVILGIVLLVGFFLGWLGLFWEPTKALAAIVGSALCGVISGEIIPAVGQGIAQLLRRTLPFVAGGAALVGTYRYCPGLLNQILVLGVVCLGLWIMVRPLFHSGRRRR